MTAALKLVSALRTCEHCAAPLLPRKRGDGRLEVPSHFAKRRFCGYTECEKVTEELALAEANKVCAGCAKPITRHANETRKRFLKRKRCFRCSGRQQKGLLARIEQWFLDNPTEIMSVEDFAIKFSARVNYVRNCLSTLTVAGVIKCETVWRIRRDDEQES